MEDYGNQHKDSSAKYMQGDTPALPSEFDTIIKSLDQEREVAYKKTKGLFKKLFFIIWPSFIAFTAILVFIFSGDTSIIFGVGGFLGAFGSAIAAFIYMSIVEGKIHNAFASKLKKELVSRIVKEVNPNLSFNEIGISKEEYDRAGLIYGSKFKSEDSIKGNLNGHNVVISECQLTVTRTSKIRKSSSASNSSQNSSSTDISFNGIFIQVELASINLASPITIIPKFALATTLERLVSTFMSNSSSVASSSVKVQEQDLITIDSALQKSDYEFFCKDPEVAQSFINQARLNVLDFIFDKYKDVRASAANDLIAGIDKDANSGIYMSIVNNTLYIALDWNEDLFEPKSSLKREIGESKLAEKIHRDILFISQIINEASLLDKVNG